MNPIDHFGVRRGPFPAIDLNQGRSIAYSHSITRRMMELIDGNNHGNVHGGVIMRMVDEAAAIVAMKHGRKPVVTARVERFDFHAPAYIGNVVTVDCALNYVGRTSMEVGVTVTAEDVMTGEIRNIASSYVVFVALDEHGKPTPVPPLWPANDEEAARIEHARIRHARMQKLNEELAQIENTPKEISHSADEHV